MTQTQNARIVSSRGSSSQTAHAFFIALILTFALPAFADTSPVGFLPRLVRDQLAIPNLPVPTDESVPMAASGRVINLLEDLKSHATHETIDQLEQDHSGYNRRDDFGGWIVADSSKGCQDTRAQVLVRSEDPSEPIAYKDSRNCLVVKGLWHDPYAGQDYKLAKAMQIDHVVPLKHVYITGGDAWTPAKRCYYANFLHNDFHLLAVAGHENMSKSDKSPEKYLPPNEAFQCQYVSSWMKVKAIWGLVATDAEVAAIERVIQDHHCADAKLEMTEDEIQAEQAAIESSVPTRCADFAMNGAPTLTNPPANPPTSAPAGPAATPTTPRTQALRLRFPWARSHATRRSDHRN